MERPVRRPASGLSSKVVDSVSTSGRRVGLGHAAASPVAGSRIQGAGPALPSGATERSLGRAPRGPSRGRRGRAAQNDSSICQGGNGSSEELFHQVKVGLTGGSDPTGWPPGVGPLTVSALATRCRRHPGSAALKHVRRRLPPPTPPILTAAGVAPSATATARPAPEIAGRGEPKVAGSRPL